MKNNKVTKIIMQIFWISLIVMFNVGIYKIKNDLQTPEDFVFGNKEQLMFILFSLLLIIYVFYTNILIGCEFYVKFTPANFYLKQNLIPCVNLLTKLIEKCKIEP